jgi:hypothetical protein
LNNPLLFNDPSGEFVNFLLGCVGGGLADLAFGEGISALSGEYKERSNWDRLKDFGVGCAMGAAGVGLVKSLDKLNDLRKLRKAKRGTCCFVAGTPIKTADGYASIDEIEIGDFVLAQDEETGQQALKRVVDIMVRPADDLSEPLVALTIGSGTESETVHVTDAHPYWVPAQQGWLKVSELKVGDELLSAGGEELVVLTKTPIEQEATYNLTVEEFDTYFVGDLEAWVHNCKRSPFPPAKRYRFNSKKKAYEAAKE